jgi:hypothetical protein
MLRGISRRVGHEQMVGGRDRGGDHAALAVPDQPEPFITRSSSRRVAIPRRAGVSTTWQNGR